MAPKSPAFQWYPKDYLADANVALMSLEQEGAYRRLIDYCWIEGSIPDDISALAHLCRVTPRKMERIWPGVRVCFEKNSDGQWQHPRLAIERRKQENNRKARSKAGQRGAKSRWGEGT